MLKGKELLGRPIVAVSNGEQVENVHDVVFDHQANRVLALLVEEGGWLHAAKAVPFGRIQSFGEKAVMIATPADVVSTKQDPELKAALAGKSNLIGLTLLTEDGHTLGKISDVYFDERTGQVEGYEATGGFFADMTSGRTFIPAPGSIQIGKDSAIVPAAVAAAMREQTPGGIRGAFQVAGQSLTGAVQTAAGSVRGAVQDAGQSVRETYENLADATRERQQEVLVGKVAGHDVLTDTGRVLVKEGETVTQAHFAEAEREGKLAALAAAVTGGTVQAAVDQLRSKVQSGAADLQEASAEKQRDFVVGKVAGDDVRTPGGVLIVAKGATISDMQASYAEREGVLPALVAAAGQGSVGQGVRGLLSDPGPTPVGASVGRRVLEDVRSPVGGLLAVQGQIVTPTIADRARELGIEDRLYAATQTQAAGVGEGLREGATEVRDQLADGLSSIAQGTEQLLGRARAWLGDKREEVEGALTRQEQEAHQARIRDALGRPVRRAVLTTTDRVILHPGEYVTHAALDEARAAGVLDLLLDSVEDTGPV